MNRKSEEKLIKLAFGDVTADEATRIEAEVASDPEATRVLNSYRDISSGLRDCIEVPADQLSKERLREAILGQGLSPKPRSAFPTWLWMPGVAAAAAFAFVAFRPHVAATANPNVVASLTQAETKPDYGIPDFKSELNFNASDIVRPKDLPQADSVSPTLETVSHTVSHKRPMRTRHNDSRRVDEDHEAASLLASVITKQGADGLSVSSAPKSSGDSMNKAVQPDAATQPAEASPIVLIEDEKDSQTGAQRATEVSTRNVIVGG